MLDPTQQPLPAELAEALERALDDGEEQFARALDLGRSSGYV